MKTYTLERTQVIERSRSETFAFFSDAFNLERITPPFLGFHMLTPRPIHMQEGTLLEYKLSLLGIPFYWKTLIEKWTPETSFVDVQLKGPYSLWRHTHTFEELDQNRTLMRDHIEYSVPLGVLGRIAHALFVRYSLKKIFDYRAAATARLLAPESKLEDKDANQNSQHRRVAS
ncbi:MAG TPA: SRPBCC family protein [Blastocatellia bacterium]|nr:SRPBCC family protein [Blastocatellia bacterium]